MRRLLGVSALAGLLACSATRSLDGTTSAAVNRGAPGDASSLRHTLDDLARFANEGVTNSSALAPGIRVGTPQGKHAAEYLEQRFSAMGFRDVVFEPFAFPQHHSDHEASSVRVALRGGDTPIAFDVFEGSGAGHVANANLEWVGTAKPEEIEGHDLHHKIAVVTRDATYHRSSQYRNVAAAGASAMLYISQAENNLIQIGSIREAWEALGPIPAVTIGKDDGERIRNATIASIDVAASASRATGQNVIATIPGRDSAHRIVVGAHYDTWYTGSVDNGGGTAALLALAELAAKRAATSGPPAYTLQFVAYDGEEVGLYGGYDYLRRHQSDGLLCALNLEMPSSEGDGRSDPLRGIATSKMAAFDRAIPSAELAGDSLLYPMWLPLDLVAQVFGGIIPTDIQGTYRANVPALSTATDSPWYHTPADTPDKVDLDFLGKGVGRFDALVEKLLAEPTSAFVPQEPSLWDADLSVVVNADGTMSAGARIFRRNDHGERAEPIANHEAEVTLFCDDFFASAPVKVTTDAMGSVQATLTAPANCAGRKFVHLTAGDTYPLVEKVASIR